MQRLTEGESTSAVAKVLIEHYRCPERFIALQLGKVPPQNSGFFRFGQNTFCYGQCASGVSTDFSVSGLPDALSSTVTEGGKIRLPFDPSEVADNLRFERYPTKLHKDFDTHGTWSRFRDLYYFLRPVIPASFRKRVQKFYFRESDKIAFPHWPVDTTIEKLFGGLLALSMKAQNIDRIPFVWFWPEAAQSCAIITHDVETSRGRDYCPTLMDIDDSFGIKSSFQVVPEKRYKVSDGFLNNIRARGFVVNIQDLNHDGLLFRSHKEFLRRADKINRYAKEYRARGFRSAVLYRNLDWYNFLDFSYDMSVPNVAHLEPQRGGCCTVLPYFIGRILELPVTTTQDYSLFNYLQSQSIDLWKVQIQLIMEQHGLINLIVHPDYIHSEKAQQTYQMLLGHLSELRSEKNVWITDSDEVDRWWRERSQLRLVERKGGWSIEGPGSVRARVAYAVLDGDRVEYQVEKS